ncbi:hypothetical protein B0H10DRAFT_1944178 [Mycena sp. CBHHK59/15]|nr:hypothetical protein B0H10DRAFT_1944178 [Mycena sp. CBHHK59/15]
MHGGYSAWERSEMGGMMGEARLMAHPNQEGSGPGSARRWSAEEKSSAQDYGEVLLQGGLLACGVHRCLQRNTNTTVPVVTPTPVYAWGSTLLPHIQADHDIEHGQDRGNTIHAAHDGDA